MKYLYDALWDIWKVWLPEEEAKRVAHGAWYSVKAKDNLRIVAINTNFCYMLNW